MIFENFDRIVFAGDSVTDMGSTNPVGEGLFDNLGKGYVRIVESLLSAAYPDVCLRITNSGISGNTSEDLLKRFDRDVVELHPQFDLPGFTSRHILPDAYEKNVEEMILKVKGNVKGIFILSPYMIEANSEDAMRARMNEYVDISRKLAEKHNCIFVDFQKMYEDYCKIRHASSIAWDRIHPNQIGSMLMARAFLDKCDFDFNRSL